MELIGSTVLFYITRPDIIITGATSEYPATLFTCVGGAKPQNTRPLQHLIE